MFVCLCNAVTQREILCAVEDGARCPGRVAELTAEGSGCGGCIERIERLIRETA